MLSANIRNATAEDQDQIVALVRAERLNPNHLDWRNFIVATDGGGIIGAVQMRRHGDGARELASLVVAPSRRGGGLAGRLISTVLAGITDPVCLVTGRQNERHYVRWGFHPIPINEVPRSVRRNFILGQLIGGAHALVTRRTINRLVVLRRSPEV